MTDNIRGIRYEISKPVKNSIDGYYYQRVRQVDVEGNLVGVGEQTFKSALPGSEDGLVGLPVDPGKLGMIVGDLGQVAWGFLSKKPGTAAAGAVRLGSHARSGIEEEYKSWPGASKPWEPPLDWRKGSSKIDLVQSPASSEIGDGRGVGNWWDNPGLNRPQNRSSRDPWAKIAIPHVSRRPLPSAPAWNDVFVRDSAAAAGVPSRKNVFEFEFPEPTPTQSLARAASPGIALRNSSLAVAPPEPGRPFELFTGRPMPERNVPLPLDGRSTNFDPSIDIVDWLASLAGVAR